MIPQWIQTENKPCRIKSIDFSVLSSESIMQISKAQVSTSELYENALTPVPNGPLDLRLGVGSKAFICLTCNQNLQHCVGHFGHSKLHLPIYHLGYFKHLIVILKMVCKYCFHVLMDKQEIESNKIKMKKIQNNYIARAALFRKIFKEASKNLKCPHCGQKNPSVQKIPKVAGKIEIKNAVMKNKVLECKMQRGLIESYDKKSEQFIYELNPWQAKNIILKIPKDELILVNIGGKTMIKDFIIDHIVVPPVCIRPSVMLTNSLSNEDDLTIKIKEMVFLNKKIFETMISKGDDINKIAKNWYILQSHWSQYINADAPGLPLQELKHKYIRSFCTRLKGKQGRFRQNLSGKRSNYTARTVISPDPNLRPDQVIVPQFMSKILTIREPVNQYNIQFLKQCIDRGNKRGGANFIITKNNEKIVVGTMKGKINIRIGDSVERHLQDNDVVIFNRQPSLHRISMMGFRVKVAAGRTLRFNECVCSPFNADFDGDEMNIHVPQTLEARSQTLHLMGVAQNIITPKSGEPIIALIQDFLTTSFLLTSKDMFFTRQQFTTILAWFSDADQLINLPPPTIMKPVFLWTGKQIISSVLRPNKNARVMVNFVTKQKNYSKGQSTCIKDGWVVFKNSEHLLGQIGKNTLGGGNKSGLIYNLLRDNTNQIACEIMHRISKLSARWIGSYGMTIGISDVTPSESLQVINKNEIKMAYQSYQNYLTSFKRGQMEAKPGMSPSQTLESLLTSSLSEVRKNVGDHCIDNLDRYNKPLIMALCGSKGNPVNLSQMIGCLGQQTVGGKRITYGFTERSLPHFLRLKQTPQARGFVKNSFFSGLTATEFFFHTMGGRQGIIDTAVKTADTGYMQRRLIKLIEDIGVMYDYTVRTCDRREIIQFRYGDDGLDPMKTEENNNPVNLKHLEEYIRELVGGKTQQQSYLKPNQIRTIAKQKIAEILTNKRIVGLDNEFQNVLLSKLEQYFKNKAERLEKDYGRINTANKQDKQYFRNAFNGITDLQLNLFFDIYIKKMNKCILEPGEAIGALTAQSIGEPATQMTLKTFHFAGISSMNITQGVPRVNQIINNTKNISTPIITINLTDASKKGAVAVKNQIEKMTLGKILNSIEEVYGLTVCSLNVILDAQTIDELSIKLRIEDIKKSIDSSLKSKIKRSEIVDSNTINIIPVNKTNLMFDLKNLRKKLVDVVIGGAITISRALISKENKEKHIIYAEGLGLKKVLSTDGVDSKKSFSNHITEIEECLGIEAARKSIIDQISLTMKQHGVNVNPRHISLLSEVMTCKGKIIGFTRNGVDKMKDSTIMLASFQKTTDFLFDAATQGKHDRMRGVSEKIIMGQPITLGTGMFDIKQCIKRPVIYDR